MQYTMIFAFALAVFGAWMVSRVGQQRANMPQLAMAPLQAIRDYHDEVEREMPIPDHLGLVPSCSRVVMYHDQKGNGLGAQVLRVFDTFLLAHKTNSTLLIARQMYWNYGCDLFVTWDCYFEPLTPYCVGSNDELRRVDTMVSPEKCTTFRTDSYEGKQCLLIADSAAEDQLFHLVHDETTGGAGIDSFTEMQSYVKEVWKPNLTIKEKAAEAMSRMGLEPGNYIGIHVRRGDKALEVPLIPLKRYAEVIEKFASKSCGTKKVFLATDDGSIIWDLMDLMPDWEILTFSDPQDSSGHLQRVANSEPLRDTVLSTMTLVAEIDILRQAAFFIGTYSSNIGRLLAVLREGAPDRSISLDVSWTPGVAWRSFNTDYCKGNMVHEEYCVWRRQQEKIDEDDDKIRFYND